MIKVLSIGEVLWDILPDKKVWGGAPVNFAYHASQFGAEATAVSAIGNDSLGDELLSAVQSCGIHLQYSVNEKATGQVNVRVNGSGQPEYSFNEDCAWDYMAFSESLKELCSEADLINFGTLAQRNPVSRQTLFKL